MSQVTDALRNVLTGFIATQPLGQNLIKAQQQQEELDQAKAYQNETLKQHAKQLADEQALHNAQIGMDQQRLNLEKAQATHARIATRLQVANTPPHVLMSAFGQGAVDKPDVINMEIGHTINVPGLGENGESMPIDIPSEESYLRDIRARTEAQQEPGLENKLELERMRVSGMLSGIQDKIESNQKLLENKLTNELDKTRLIQENENLRNFMNVMQKYNATQARYGSGDFDPSPYVERIKSGDISEEQLKTELGGRIGAFNSVRNAATKAGYAIPDKKQVGLLRGLSPAVGIIPKMIDLENKITQNPVAARTPFTNVNAETSRTANEINEGLLSVQPQISQNTRLSDPRINRLTSAYGITKSVFGNTSGSRRQGVIDYVDLLNKLFEDNTRGMSKEQQDHIKQQLGIPDLNEIYTDTNTGKKYHYLGGDRTWPESWKEVK